MANVRSGHRTRENRGSRSPSPPPATTRSGPPTGRGADRGSGRSRAGAAEAEVAKPPATCKLCGVELTEQNTYATFRGRDRRCRDCHILYMRELRRKERMQKELENGSLEPSTHQESSTSTKVSSAVGFFSFCEDEI